MTKKLEQREWGAWLLIAGLVAWQIYVAGPDASTDGGTLIRYGARKPNFHFPQAPWRLLASVFLHGGWMHLITNCLVIFLWGGRVCRLVGQLPFLAVFLVSGIVGSLVSDVYGPEALALGASGGVAGLVFFVLILALLAPKKSAWGGEAKSWLWSSVAAVALNVLMALGLTGVLGARLDHWAHAGGALAGLALALAAARDGKSPKKLWMALALVLLGVGVTVFLRGSTPFG